MRRGRILTGRMASDYRVLSYKHMMTKTPISVTLHRENVTWLKGRAEAAGHRSVSEFLDRLVTAARQAGQIAPARSVVGTVEIDSSDPLLEGADTVLRDLFEASLTGIPIPSLKPERRSHPNLRRKRRG